MHFIVKFTSPILCNPARKGRKEMTCQIIAMELGRKTLFILFIINNVFLLWNSKRYLSYSILIKKKTLKNKKIQYIPNERNTFFSSYCSLKMRGNILLRFLLLVKTEWEEETRHLSSKKVLKSGKNPQKT